MPHTPISLLVSRFVDGTPSTAAQLVRNVGIASRAANASQVNQFVSGLDSLQRESLAQLLQRERQATLFDALVYLQESISKYQWQVEAQGTILNLEPRGYTLAEEYLAQTEPQSS